MPRGGARPGAGRKPGSKAGTKSIAKAVIKAEERKRRAAPAMQGLLDSLEVMRRGLQIMVNEVGPALKAIHDRAAGEKDAKTQLATVRELKGTVLDAHTIAKDLAPYEHRRLAGEKPLDQDKAQGPAQNLVVAEELAV